MKVKNLITELKKRDQEAEISFISESFDEYLCIKVWEHPENPNDDILNPEIIIPN